MATTPVKLIALAAAMAAVVALSFFFQLRCSHLPTSFMANVGLQLIVVSNQQEVTDGNVQLLCHGCPHAARLTPKRRRRKLLESDMDRLRLRIGVGIGIVVGGTESGFQS
uniref:Uncharacterized protein n=1 Tax=Oryza brachyantha TaxID=4533 RepID=J3MEG3_ORYBR